MSARASYWKQIVKIVFGTSNPEIVFENLKTTLHSKIKIVRGVL